MTAAWIVLLAVAILVLAFGIVAFVMSRVRRSSDARIAARFGPGEVVLRDPLANYQGLASRGGRQLVGNGALVLTRDLLWFHRFGAGEPLEIPLSRVRDADLVRAHAGRSVGRDLVRVEFEGGPDGVDSAAWWVREPGPWLEELRARRR
ncbi:MAG TPA: hypothetical protein VGD67_06665 [Pseudonocardiaceae bacterium]